MNVLLIAASLGVIALCKQAEGTNIDLDILTLEPIKYVHVPVP